MSLLNLAARGEYSEIASRLAELSGSTEHSRLRRKSSIIDKLFRLNVSERIQKHLYDQKVVQAINATNKHGMNALHAACFHGYLDIVQLLIQHNAEVNYQSTNPSGNWTFPLHIAAFKGDKDIIKCLWANGADLYLLDFRGMTAMEVAEGAGHPRTARLLRDLLNKEAESYEPQAPTIRHYTKITLPIEKSRMVGEHSLSATDLLFAEATLEKSAISLQNAASSDCLPEHLMEAVEGTLVGELPPGPWDHDDLFVDRRARNVTANSINALQPSVDIGMFLD